MTLGYLAGHIVIILPNFLLPSVDALWQDEFSKHYPNKKWIVFLYPIFFISGFFGFGALMEKTQPFTHFTSEIASSFYFVFWIITGIGIAGGLFEVLTGVSPLPEGSKRIKDSPFYFKAPWLHQYRYHPQLAWRARVIGGLRILLGLFFLFLTFLVGYFSLL
ncbi:MAG: hypothetical protein JNM55_07085 [Anaerolineales bacterium]|nr:hypothetical protein [Anaerolineales bacterium]